MGHWPAAPVVDDSVASIVAVGQWVRAVERIHSDLRTCSAVVEAP